MDGHQAPKLNSWFEEYVLAGWIGDSIFLFQSRVFLAFGFFAPGERNSGTLRLGGVGIRLAVRTNTLYIYMQILTLFPNPCKV